VPFGQNDPKEDANFLLAGVALMGHPGAGKLSHKQLTLNREQPILAAPQSHWHWRLLELFLFWFLPRFLNSFPHHLSFQCALSSTFALFSGSCGSAALNKKEPL
jgi:hypothetical protein